MTALSACGRAVLRGLIYFAVIALAAQIAVDLNYRWAPHAPVAYVIGIPVLVLWSATLGRRWSGYRLVEISAQRDAVGIYVALAIALCLAGFVIAGKYTHLVSGFPPAPENSGAGWRVSSALFTGGFAAIAEEVTFRGILQGNFARVFDPRIALALATSAFCALHAFRTGFAAQLPFYVVLGLSTALIAQITQSVAPGIAIHIVTNLMLAVLTLIWGPIEWARLPNIGVWVAVAIGGVALAGMVVVLRRLQGFKLLSAHPVSASPPYSAN